MDTTEFGVDTEFKAAEVDDTDDVDTFEDPAELAHATDKIGALNNSLTSSQKSTFILVSDIIEEKDSYKIN